MEDKKTLESVEGSVEEDFNSLDWLKNNADKDAIVNAATVLGTLLLLSMSF